MPKYQVNLRKLIRSISSTTLIVFSGAATAIATPNSELSSASTELSSSEFTKIEEAIFDAIESDLPKLEIRIARMLQNNPGNIHANYLMSTLLLKMYTTDPGSFILIKQSTDLAAQTYDLSRKNELGIAALANILEISGESERGLSMLNEVERRGIPIGWRTKLAKAKLLQSSHNPELVLQALEDALSDPRASHHLISPVLIQVLLEKYDGDEQINKLKEWKTRCKSVAMDLALAASHAISGENEAAMKIYFSILEQQPHNIEALINQGIIAMRLKNYSLAVKRFSSAIEHGTLPGDLTAAQTNLATALISEKRQPELAKKAAYDAIKGASDTEGVLIGILATYRKESSVATTLSFLDDLETSVPGLHLGYALKAELLSEKLGRYYDAMQSFTNAITLEPMRSEYYNGRGLAWMGIGRIEVALNDFESATFANPDDASARYNFACALARLGRKEDAVIALGMAFEMDQRLMIHAQTDQDLASLRPEPSFKALFDGNSKQFSVAH
jgi:tetratricopeptide (TPR) repeat protein